MKTIFKIMLIAELVLCVGCCTMPYKETKIHCEVNTKDDIVHPPSVGVVFSIDKTF